MLKHSKFIYDPISNIIKDAVKATSGLSCRMETYPMSEYLFQSVFLKMTGASEQKLKCICWDIATYDYEYRYSYLKDHHGECSDKTDKNNIFKGICECIRKKDETFNLNCIIPDKKNFINEVRNAVVDNIKGTVLSQWKKKDFEFFCKNNGFVVDTQLKCSCNCILENKVWEDYEEFVYKHRNRCAHNLESYQTNLPTLSKLSSNRHEYDNYFYRFSILILLDKIAILLYDTYLKTLENSY